MPFRRLRRGDRPVRRRLLPHLPGRGGTPRPAAAHDAGGELAGHRGRRHRPGPAERDPHGRLHRDQQRRVPDDGRGLAQAQRGGRVPLRPQRDQPERCQRAGLLRPGPDGAGQGGRCGLRLVPGGGARRGGGPPAGQGGSGHRGRSPGHPQHQDLRTEGGRDDAVPRRAVQGLRCLRQRLRPGRGLWRGRPEAAERGGGRRRPGVGGHPGCGGEPRRSQYRSHRPPHARAGTGDGDGPVGCGCPFVGGRLPGGARHRDRGGRPDRDRCRGQCLRTGTPARPAPAHRLCQDQHRPSRVGRRNRRADQGGAGGEPGGDPEAPALPRSPPGRRLGPVTPAGDLLPNGLAGRPSGPAAGRGELLRDIRHQRPPRGGGAPRPGRRAQPGTPDGGRRSGRAGVAAASGRRDPVDRGGPRSSSDPPPAALGQVRERPRRAR